MNVDARETSNNKRVYIDVDAMQSRLVEKSDVARLARTIYLRITGESRVTTLDNMPLDVCKKIENVLTMMLDDRPDF